MTTLTQRLAHPRTVGLVFVVAAHVALLWTLLQQRIVPVPEPLKPLFVQFIEPPKPEPPKVEPPKPKPPPPKPRPEPPKPPPPHQHLVVEAPAKPTDYVAPPPPPPPPSPEPVVEAAPPPPPPPPPKPAGPVQLSGDLSLACPTRTPPSYPALSRRLGETGKTVLRVSLNRQGGVSSARVVTSSGFKRLDDAALKAVQSWQCNPPSRGGEPVEAVALQPFNFNLE